MWIMQANKEGIVDSNELRHIKVEEQYFNAGIFMVVAYPKDKSRNIEYCLFWSKEKDECIEYLNKLHIKLTENKIECTGFGQAEPKYVQG